MAKCNIAGLFFEKNRKSSLTNSVYLLDYGSAQYNHQIEEITQYSDAEIDAFSEMIRLNPNDAQAYQKRGKIYAAREFYNQAIEDYNQSLTLDPNNYHTYNYRGTAYYRLENYQQALADYNQAISLNPDFALAYYNRGYVRQKLADKQGAIDDFRQGANLSLQQGDQETYQQALEIIKNLEQQD